MKTLAFILLSKSSKKQYQKVVGRGVSQFILGERIKHGAGLHDTDYPQIFQVQIYRAGAKIRAKGVQRHRRQEAPEKLPDIKIPHLGEQDTIHNK